MSAPHGDRPDTATILRYAALQLPGLLLVSIAAWAAIRWTEIPPALAYAGIGAWVIKDIVMFRFVWRSFAPREGNGLHDIRGRTGTVVEALAPEGRVRVGSEHWRAVSPGGDRSVAAGTRIRVTDIQGLRLTVEALNEASEAGE